VLWLLKHRTYPRWSISIIYGIVTAVLSSDSSFRRLPAGLNTRQAMYFDGVRFAIEMLALSYSRLEVTLAAVANDEQAKDLTPGIFLDAWGVVDSANRLRVLLSEFPGLKKKTPPAQLLARSLQPVEVLRNSVQHLPGDINLHADSDIPTWGTLHWMFATGPERVKMLLLVPGCTRKMTGLGRMPSPAGRAFHAEVDHVTLSAYGNEVDLSEVHRAVAAFVPSIEAALDEAFQEHEERAGSDLLISMDLVANTSHKDE